MEYKILSKSKSCTSIYPYLLDERGDKDICCVSPIHCRSFVVGRHEDGKYIVSKGNGLSYSEYRFLELERSLKN